MIAASYAVLVRPRLARWCATDLELERPSPAADLIPGGRRISTMAATLDAPPARVWPWLVQMGSDRAGWYSWDRLDNAGVPSSTTIRPEWQRISVGDRFAAAPDGSAWFEVAALEPERSLCLRISIDLRGRPFDPRRESPRCFVDSAWDLVLEEVAGGRTRLVVSVHVAIRPLWLRPVAVALVLEPSHWFMQTRQFRNLGRRVRGSVERP